MQVIVEDRTFTLDAFSPEAIEEAAASLAQDKTILFGLVNVKIEPRDHPAAERLRKALYGHIYGLGNSSADTLLGIRNTILNAPQLLRAAAITDIPKISAPVIAVGAAPSLSNHLARLRVLQKSCLIICSDTILGGLMAEGIYPHVVTPLERTPDMPDRLPKDPGETVYAGTTFFDPRGVTRFKHHLLVSSAANVGQWIGTTGIGYGSSTGTMSVAVGLQLTTGNVHLVGHDLSFPADRDSHWSPATAIRANAEQQRDKATIIGHNGETLDTTNLFRMYATDMSLLAMGYGQRVVNVNAFNAIGALIPGTKAGDLPAPGPDLNWVPPATVGDERLDAFHKRMDETERGIDTAIERIRQINTISLLQVDTLGTEAFRPLLEMVMRSVWVQFSFERHMGAPEKVVLPALKEAMVRVLNQTRNEITKARECARSAT